jgi:hypothetical protein
MLIWQGVEGRGATTAPLTGDTLTYRRHIIVGRDPELLEQAGRVRAARRITMCSALCREIPVARRVIVGT